MCVDCLKKQHDITEGIANEIIMHQCRSCHRYLRPPWEHAELESAKLLDICLKKVPYNATKNQSLQLLTLPLPTRFLA